MKNLKTLLFITIVGSMLFASSCSKDDDPSRTDLLTSSDWRFVSMEIDPPIDFLSVLISDMFTLMDECEKDDLMIFDEDGSYQNDEGATLCEVGDPQISEEGTWAFNSDESQLIVTAPEEVMTFDIVSISSDELNMTTILDLEDVMYTYTLKLVAN